jgi:hypothetical protein
MARIGVRSEELRQQASTVKAGATQVQQAMDSMGIFLDEAARAYEETDESLRARR